MHDRGLPDEKPAGFAHDRLDVYRLAEESLSLVGEIARRIPPRAEHLRSQAVRAASSVVLNIAEGAAETSRGDKARFYRMARRSAGELAAVLTILQRLGIVRAPEIDESLGLLQRISRMLYRLIESQSQTKGPVPPATPTP